MVTYENVESFYGEDFYGKSTGGYRSYSRQGKNK